MTASTRTAAGRTAGRAGARRVLITGRGQLATELMGTVRDGWRAEARDSDTLDVRDAGQVRRALLDVRPAVVINTAAFTRVDAAEHEPETAFAVNAEGARHVAEAAREIGARVIQVSTDFVFDGAQGRPYHPDDAPCPLGVYGRTKLEGERAVLRVGGDAGLVVRTAWLYAGVGRNFVRTMLRLLAGDQPVRVVADQVGTPTWARSLAQALWAAVERPEVAGVHHWTDSGVASWYDFAWAIQEEALRLGLLARPVPITPIRTGEHPTAARRPPYSVLDTHLTRAALERPGVYWRENLRLMLAEMARG